MLAAAIVLLVLLLIFAIGAVVSNPDPTTLHVFIAEIPATTAVVFLTGMVTGFLLLLSVGMLVSGLRRQVSRSKEIRHLRKAGAAAQHKATTTKGDQPAVPADRAGQRPEAAPKTTDDQDARS